MARTGRFGRLPRTAPNLASVIVSMVREVNAQEDSNILQAWEEGGIIDGEKVTDEMLLAHFRKRRDSMSKTDPLWEKWNTTLQNYEFAIAESKMTLKYAEKKVGEGQMASFYREWAGKLPKNSEAYRNLMRSAAQFADAAKARAGGGGGGGRRSSGGRRSGGSQEAYNAAALGAYERYEQGWDEANFYMLNAAYRAGILQITDTADPDDLMDLRGGDEADHARFIELFDLVQNDPLYADIRNAMEEAGLDGLTYSRFIALADAKETGLETRIAIARQFGDDSGAKDLTEEKTEFVTQRAIIGDTDEFAAYQTNRRTIDSALAAGGLSPFDVYDMLSGYADSLTRLQSSAQSEQTRGFLNNEILALRGEDVVGPTAFEGNEGGIRTRSGGDAQTLGALMAAAAQQVELIESGRAFLTAGVNELGQPSYGVITRDDMRLRDPNGGRVVFNSVGAGNRRSVPTFVNFRPILVQGTYGADPRTGAPTSQVAPSGSEVLGLTYTLNGKDYYGIFTGGGGTEVTWFADNPFRTGQFTDTEQGLVLTAAITDDMLTTDATGEQVFDPLSVIEARALNPDLQYANRFGSALEAVYVTDPIARQALMRASDAELALVSESSPNPEETWAELRDLRNTAVDRHNAVRTAQRDFGIPRSSLSGRAELQQRIDAGEDVLERTGESEAEKARALQTLEAGRAWESRYRQTNPERGTVRPTTPTTFIRDPKLGAATAGLARLTSGEGYLNAEGSEAGFAPRQQPLPAIKLPDITAVVPRPAPVTGQTVPLARPGIDDTPVAPRTPTPTAPTPPPPRPPLLPEDEEEFNTPEIVTPTMPRPRISTPTNKNPYVF